MTAAHTPLARQSEFGQLTTGSNLGLVVASYGHTTVICNFFSDRKWQKTAIEYARFI